MNKFTLNTDGASIETNGNFAAALRSVILETKPCKLIETGTCIGLGSTAVIVDALAQTGVRSEEIVFYSLEINPDLYNQALKNVSPNKARLLNGLSIPRTMLPSADQINATCKLARQYGVDVDPRPGKEAEFYGGETNFPRLPDDLLGSCLANFNYAPDFVMLDSSGGMGWTEFDYLMSLIKPGPLGLILALDDIHHVKHFQSYRAILRNLSFQILEVGKERHGYCIARLMP